MFSLIGRRVLLKKIKGINTYQLSVEALETGNYILNIKSDSMHKSMHFIKE
ncbi:hypothetical protein [Aquimarina sp. AU474]|uniref:hypothetical protein n=1 Tax=Aquimarina sp. AU474 TaxID=2108529 RepID=UPI000D695C20